MPIFPWNRAVATCPSPVPKVVPTQSPQPPTPYATLLRLTSFLFYSKEEAELLLLTYKSYISPYELLRLFKIRFYHLTKLPEKALALCNASAFQLGVSFDEVEHITLQLLALEDKDLDNKSSKYANENRDESSSSSSEKELVDGMERQSLVRKRGDSVTSTGAKNYIKGVDTSLQLSSSNESAFTVQNSCIGKIYSGDDMSILNKLMECLRKCFDSVEMVSHALILRGSGRFFILENVSMCRTYRDITSWSCRLVSDNSTQSGLRIPGVSEIQVPCKISSLSLRCMPAHKMMRGKAVYELQVSFVDTIAQSIELDAAVLATHKEELCLVCAKVLFGFACDAFSPDIPLLRAPRLLTSKSTIDIFEEASDTKCRGEMEALQSCQRQLTFLENEFSLQVVEGS